MFIHWGLYSQWGGHYPGPNGEMLDQNLVDIVSEGGNYLPNVGPTGQGMIPEGAVDDLKQVGAWMKANGESIYGTGASPLSAQPAWGRVTKKGGTLYLHVFDWPKNGMLTVSVPATPAQALWTSHLLADAKPLPVDVSSGAPVITLPSQPPDPVDAVVG